MVLGGGWPGGLQESGRRGPVERFAGLKTRIRIGNLDAETEIRSRFGRGTTSTTCMMCTVCTYVVYVVVCTHTLK